MTGPEGSREDYTILTTNIADPTITSAVVTSGSMTAGFSREANINVSGNIVGSYYGYATVTEKSTGKVLYPRQIFSINDDDTYNATLKLMGATSLGGQAVVTIEDYFGKSVTTEVTLPTIDNEAPTISNLHSVSLTDGWAQQKTLTLYVSDAGTGTAYVALNRAEDSDFVAVPDGHISWTLTGNIFEPKNLCVFVKDSLGNMQSHLIPVDKLDITAPTIDSMSLNPASWTKGPTVLSVAASDAGGGLAAKAYRFGSDDWQSNEYTSCVVNGTTVVTVRDVAGNTRTATKTISTIDTKAPSFSVSGNPTSWTKNDAVLSISAADNSDGCGLHAQPYSFDGGVSWQASPSKAFSQNGTYTIKVRDAVGNVSDGKDVVISYIDKEAPAMTVVFTSVSSDYKSVITQIYASDADGSGIKDYCWDYNESTGSGTWTAAEVKALPSGETRVLAVRDKAGNISCETVTPKAYEIIAASGGGYLPMATNSEDFSLENIVLGPSKYISKSGIAASYSVYTVAGAEKTGLAVEISAKPRFGGVMTGYAKLEGIKYPIYWGSLSDGYTTTRSSATGTFILSPSDFYTSRKGAKLTVYLAEYADDSLSERINEDVVSTTISIDRTPPVANVSLNQMDMSVTITTKDTLSGVSEVSYKGPSSTDWTPYTGPFYLTENGVIQIKATDNVGNVTTPPIESAYITRPGTESGFAGVSTSNAKETFRSHWFNYFLFGTK